MIFQVAGTCDCFGNSLGVDLTEVLLASQNVHNLCLSVYQLTRCRKHAGQYDKASISRVRTCFVTGKGTPSNFQISWSIVNSLSKTSSAFSCREFPRCPSLPRRVSWRSTLFAGTPLNELRPFKDSTSFTSLFSHRSSSPVYHELY